MEFFYHFFFNQRFNSDCGKGKGKVSTQAKWPSQPEFILVLIAWSNWGYHCSPLDASPSQGYAAAPPLPPTFHQVSLTICQYPFILLVGERHSEGKTFLSEDTTLWLGQVLNTEFSTQSPVHQLLVHPSPMNVQKRQFYSPQYFYVS